MVLAGHGDQVARVFRSPRLLGQLAISALMIVSGWSVYVWAVNNGHNIEAALGYYINPLLNMAIGATFFRERINAIGLGAIALATVGTVLQALALGHPPLIALFLAVTFTIYGVIRKRVEVDAQAGLFVESLLMFLPGLALVLWLAHTGVGDVRRAACRSRCCCWRWGRSRSRRWPSSPGPRGACRSRPSGFLQFTGPTLGFLIGLVVGERLTPLGLVSFGFIWAGVALFMFGAWRAGRRVAIAPRPRKRGPGFPASLRSRQTPGSPLRGEKRRNSEPGVGRLDQPARPGVGDQFGGLAVHHIGAGDAALRVGEGAGAAPAGVAERLAGPGRRSPRPSLRRKPAPQVRS